MEISKQLKLYAPEDYWNATKEERDSVTNGCGEDGWKGALVPDELFGVDITQACNIDDWMYEKGKTLADKDEADRVFFNMVRTINYNADNFFKKVQLVASQAYYKAVCLFGGIAYWEDKNSSSNFRVV